MHRTLLAVSTLAVVAALLAPAALPQRPDDRAGAIGVGSVGGVTTPASFSVRPDDRAGVRGPGAFSAAPATILVTEDDGFDWRAAGIGLAGGLGLALVAAALLVTTTHRRRPHQLA